MSLHGLKDLPGKRGAFVSHNAVWRFLKREGLGLKKALFSIGQGRSDVARRRRRWKGFMSALDPRKLVFIGENWVNTNMAPIRGWGRKGKRSSGFAPHGCWNIMSFIAALRHDGLSAPHAFSMTLSTLCAFVPMWNSFLCRPSNPEISSSWTIWEAIRQSSAVRSSKRLEHDYGSCPLTPQTSTRSSKPSPK
jgi:hypothetical protein